ncbi:MAG: hypothetical protein U0183_09680 [Polyangiaceae bacterium]
MKLPILATVLGLSLLSIVTGCAVETTVEPLPEPPSPAPSPEPTRVVTHALTIRDLAQLETIAEVLDRSPDVKRIVTFVGTSTWDEATWTRVDAWVAARPPMTVLYEA